MAKIIGRDEELSHLESFYKLQDSKLLVLYGRRRIGKSYLIRKFIENKPHLYFEGIEDGNIKDQLRQVSNQLFLQINDPLLRGFNPHNWNEFLDTLMVIIKSKKREKKIVLVFDEIQWLASNRTKLISILKTYWDNHFLNSNIILILCGSVAHYVVKKVIKSKALYGRISSQMLIQQLKPKEARKMISKRGDLEALKYLLLLGGIPKYLEEINQNETFDKNIDNLFFRSTGFFYGEIEKIFFSQFKEAKTYRKIIELLCQHNLSLEDLAKKLNIKSSGGLKEYLIHLELAQFIKANQSLLNMNKKRITYRTIDEYLRFYNQYVRKWEPQIKEGAQSALFQNHIKSIWNPWLGLAFENFCNKNSFELANSMKFTEQIIKSGPYIIRNKKSVVVQYDLAYERKDNVLTLCEIKWSEDPIDISIIAEFENKINRSNFPSHLTIEKVLIAPMGGTKSLRASNYLNHILTLKDLI